MATQSEAMALSWHRSRARAAAPWAALAIALAACGGEVATNNAGSAGCGANELQRMDAKGNKYCVKVDPDGGTLADSEDGAGVDGAGVDGSASDGGSGDDGGASDGAVADANDGSASADGADGADGDAGSTDPWWQCPPVKGTGKEHGKACTDHSECMYGFCMKGGFLAGYDGSKSFCTKNNACTGGASFTTAPCDYDDDPSKSIVYKATFETSKSNKNDKRTSAQPIKLCARSCKSDSECAAWNPDLPHCLKGSTKYVSIGTQPVCVFDPTR